jgi:hypothetical protein
MCYYQTSIDVLMKDDFMRISFLRGVGFFVIVWFAIPVLAQQPTYVLVRQDPIISAPYASITQSSKEEVSISAGSGRWELNVRGAGETEDRYALIANIEFTLPPEKIIPGKNFMLTSSGLLSGYVKGGASPGPQLAFYVEGAGVKVTNHLLNFYASSLPDVGSGKRSGNFKDGNTAAFVVSKNPGKSFNIRVIFGSTGRPTIVFPYKAIEGELPDTPAEFPCAAYVSDSVRIGNQYATLERTNTTPGTFRVDVEYKQRPFELCIKDGKATLKSAPEIWQQMAGAASKILDSYVGGVASGSAQKIITGGAVSSVSELGGKVSAAVFRDMAKKRAQQMGNLTLYEIRRISQDAKVIENFSDTAISTALSQSEPSAIAQSKFEAKIQEIIGGGAVIVAANEGLEIYNQLMVSAEVVRANNKALYCKILESQYSVGMALRALVKRAQQDSSNACAKDFLDKNYADIRQNLRKLEHDITSAGQSNYSASFGNSWMFDKSYGSLSCVTQYRNLARSIGRKL